MEEAPSPMACVDGILSTDGCPVCHSNEHKLVDCKSQDIQTMVRMLKEMAEKEQKATSMGTSSGFGVGLALTHRVRFFGILALLGGLLTFSTANPS